MLASAVRRLETCMTGSMRRKQDGAMLDETVPKHCVAMVFNQLENQNGLQMSIFTNSGIIHFFGNSSGRLKMAPADF